eukprot:CAMPEP_0178976438 /NCGR_PEP_ID=MMETSP0789-20121207/23837_1 /TAXON_ID=3005 /ORGANISM="Rhizosolenia setigera, Strain CCMP 1694" /LENGTH=902 /DNA_ID=CAMNT_0020665533 /DNA_START=288 /DNA_END=2996 /DNA_ORIENTATION=-
MSVNPLGTIDSSESTGIINRTEQNVEPHQNYGSTPSTNNAYVGSRPKPGLQRQTSTRNAFKLISKHDLDLQREIISISEQQQERNDEPIPGYSNGYMREYDNIDNNSEGDDDGLFFTCADILVEKFKAYFRHYIFDEDNPEFTSLQSFVWAIFIGVFMGIYTAKWGELIEFSVDIVWEKVPSYLVEKGIFTDVDGHLPLPHYMWITPAIFSGILSYVTVKLPCQIPGQNEWIDTLHRKGIMEHETFFYTFIISTLGMASGMSLGPELPLVLTSGMVGSFLGKYTRQSMLSARVVNLTAASAAIGGFFGFPMAGALFVLELPHNMGLQYFEALNPSIIASIISVLVNRIVSGSEIGGMFTYPFLSNTLPSHIFYIAVIYGVLGAIIGNLYCYGCIFLKTKTHDLFHGHHEEHHEEHELEIDTNVHPLKVEIPSEDINLIGRNKAKDKVDERTILQKIVNFEIKDDGLRASVVGVLAGIVVGLICMFLPHNLFWGEAQLQTLIDNGKTRLPVFGEGDEPTAALTAYGFCMPSGEEDFEFSITCTAFLTLTKILVIGLSLGTGIVGGHFWGPLYVGAAAARFFTSSMEKAVVYIDGEDINYGEVLFKYPCLAIICIMGSAHVVTFKANMAIMLILTLTIATFDNQNNSEPADYSAIFPLLVVSCFTSLMLTRSSVFYAKQRNRGDIIVSESAFCEPGKEGQVEEDEITGSDYDDLTGDSYDNSSQPVGYFGYFDDKEVTQKSINEEFIKNNVMQSYERNRLENESPVSEASSGNYLNREITPTSADGRSSLRNLSERSFTHSRTNSIQSERSRTPKHRRKPSFGEFKDGDFHDHPLEQARRKRTSSRGNESETGSVSGFPSSSARPKHKKSQSLTFPRTKQISGEAMGAIPLEDNEKAFRDSMFM